MLVSSKIKNGINGNVEIPGDKSISHRSIIIPSIAKGTSQISNLLLSDDVINTLEALKKMGVGIQKNDNDIIIIGNGLNSLTQPKGNIFLGNSGTSARLLIGLLSSQKFISNLSGDESLSKRPMNRIIEPLKLMGAKFENNKDKLPLKIFGQNLKNIVYELKLPSAQVKSGIILAALNTQGTTEIIEKEITRNHTEIMLESFGADLSISKNNKENHIKITGKKELKASNIQVPSDLSSAAFFIVAAMINKNSKVMMNNININSTRNGILEALKMMGGKIKIANERNLNGETVGDIYVTTSELRGCELNSDIARLMIDEYPILSVAASFANSPSKFMGLKELRVKESDRLELIKYNLNICGIFSTIEDDNLFIDPTKKIQPKDNQIKTDNDHRIAMSFAIMGTKLGIDLKIMNSEFIKTSFPNFVTKLNLLGGNLTE